MDGCSSHYSAELVYAAMQVQVLLVCLPANGTHLLRPLDVSCFSSLKKAIRKDVHEFMVETGAINITKRDAVQIGVSAWMKCNLDANLKAGFETTVLFPLNKVAMINRFRRFQGNELLQQEATKPATKKAKKSASKIANSSITRMWCEVVNRTAGVAPDEVERGAARRNAAEVDGTGLIIANELHENEIATEDGTSEQVLVSKAPESEEPADQVFEDSVFNVDEMYDALDEVSVVIDE
ncbi:hypothetical protein P43SY_002423 [Pythium insidiosum]|uniref:DDE-1 domain-containing protein n=1 Tax=Pythium insidiosum TaxID=114742 RepID=A0AAD5Q592_PYTIN|nr:hypothetical protein P43SY_002423 [Pythium insidiosum]